MLADVIAMDWLWLMLLANVTDVKATVFCFVETTVDECCCGRCYSHILDRLICVQQWQMELPHCMGWCFTQSNSWNSHNGDSNLFIFFMWQME